MRLLGVARLRLVPAELRQPVSVAVVGLHELGDLAERRFGDGHRVGPHIGDEAYGALARKIDALVQALGHRHRLARAEAELAGGLLLQRRRGEGRGGRALPLLLLDLRDAVVRTVQPFDVGGGVGLGPEQDPLLVGRGGELALGHLGQAGGERGLGILRREADVDAPVFDRVERRDLTLALDDQPDCHRLHPPGGEARSNPFPQDRPDPVPDEPIQDTARLLGVDELHVDAAGIGDRLQDRVARDLGERRAFRADRVDAEQRRNVEGDRFALAVVVRREDQVVGAAEGALQLSDVPFRVLGHDVLGLEVSFEDRRRAWTSGGPGYAHRKPGRCSHRPGTSRWSSPWPAIRPRRGSSACAPSRSSSRARVRGLPGAGRYHRPSARPCRSDIMGTAQGRR